MGVETRGGLWGIRPLPLPRGCLFSRADPQSPVLPHAVSTQERGTADPGPLPACNPLPHGGKRADWQVRVGQTEALASPGPSQQVPVLPWLLDTASGDSNSSSRNHSLCLTSQVEGTEHGGVAQLVNPSPRVFTFPVSSPSLPCNPVSQPGSQVWGLCTPGSVHSQPVSEPVSCLQKGKGRRARSFLLLLQLVLPTPHSLRWL